MAIAPAPAIVARDFPGWLPPMLVKELRQGLRTRGFIGTLMSFQLLMLILTLIAFWNENALLVSMSAVGIVVPQIFWVLDFAGGLVGLPINGMTAYMFKSENSLFLRLLSLFHGWLPFLLIYMVWKLGYDRRAFLYWTVLAWALILVCFFFMPPPNPNAGLTPVNINYVYGFGDAAAQTFMPGWAWLALLYVGLPLLVFLPTHVVLKRWKGGNT